MTTDPSLTLVADALVEAHDNRGAPWCPECRGPERAAEEVLTGPWREADRG